MKARYRLKLLAGAAFFAATLSLAASPGWAGDINIRAGFQLDGDAFDTKPTTAQPLTVDTDSFPHVLDDGGTDVEGKREDQDDWAKFDPKLGPPPPASDSDELNAGIVTEECSVAGGTDWESCGHVAGPDELPDKDSHTGGNSAVHFFRRDNDREKDGAGDDNIFTNGSSINLDVCDWRVTNGSTPPKDDIEDAFAAFYSIFDDGVAAPGGGAGPGQDDELLFYGGTSLLAPNGSAKVGFWLLQKALILIPPDADENPTTPVGDFTFADYLAPIDYSGRFLPPPEIFDPTSDPDPCLTSQLHEEDDALFGLDFTNGGGTVITTLFTWSGGVLTGGGQTLSANCQNPAGATDQCGTANANPNVDPAPKDAESPESWTYQSAPKDHPPNKEGNTFLRTIPDGDLNAEATDNFGLIPINSDDFPGTTFFEGGINLTTNELDQGCFNTFIAFTSASFSVTSAMKDLVFGQLASCTSTVETEIHEGTDHATDVQFISMGDELVGSPTVHDSGTVTGSNLGTPIDPLGMVKVQFYDDFDCVSGNESGSSTNVALSAGTPNDGISTYDNALQKGPLLPGDYSYGATYLGNPTQGFPPTGEECQNLRIIKFTSAVRTEIHEEDLHNINLDVLGGGAGSLDLGDDAHDFIEVTNVTTPGAGPDPTGNVTVNIFNNNTCAGSPLGTIDSMSLPYVQALQPQLNPSAGAGTGITDPPNNDPANVLDNSSTNGRARAETPDFTLLSTDLFNNAAMANLLSIKASYAGDSNYLSDEGDCERLTVNKLTLTIATHILVQDLIKITAPSGGPAVTQTDSIKLFIHDVANCADPTPQVVDNLDLDGSLEVVYPADGSEIVLLNGQNAVSFIAQFKGDNNYEPITHTCESVSASLFTPPE